LIGRGKAPTQIRKFEELFQVGSRRAKFTGVAPERKKMEDLEKLYYMEPLLFAGVNFYVNQAVSAGLEVEAQDKKVEAYVRDWIERVNLVDKLEKVMQDMCIYGNAFLELVWDRKRTEIVDLAIIDPKSIDFIRDRDNLPLVDAIGRPVGYIQKVPEEKPEYRQLLQDIVTAKGVSMEQVSFEVTGIPFAAEDLAHFRLYILSDTLMGVGLIEPLYDTVILKLQVEEALGHGLQKSGFPLFVAKLGKEGIHEPTEAEIKTFEEKVMSQIDEARDLVVPYYYDIDILGVSKIEKLKEYLDYFVDLIASGLSIPHSILLRGERIGSTVADVQADNAERKLKAFQAKLISITREQILEPLIRAAGFKEVPRLRFKPTSSIFMRRKADRLGILARAGLLTPDRDLEAYIRSLEDLPAIPEETPEARERRERVRAQVIRDNAKFARVVRSEDEDKD
jgi:hypothetical protein